MNRSENRKSVLLSKPRQGTISGKWSIFLSRRIDKADGSFGGFALLAAAAVFAHGGANAADDAGKWQGFLNRGQGQGVVAGDDEHRKGQRRTQGVAISPLRRGVVPHQSRPWCAPHLAAGRGFLVDDYDAQAYAGRREGSVRAGRAGPQDDQVMAHGTPRNSTAIPAETGVRQAWRKTPSTCTAHSWQTPMKQNAPRGVPSRGLTRSCKNPRMASAEASGSPAGAEAG